MDKLKGCWAGDFFYLIFTRINEERYSVLFGDKASHLGIRMLLIAVRVGILAYIIFSGISFGRAFPDSTLTYIQGSLYIFYVPAAVFLLTFTFVFLSKKWLYCTLAMDILLVFALKIIWKLFIY
ncbi:hypothetical protein P5G51_007655 [Virgibacillus sp. 179-BFC.A HS]|uniref:Uncharacterized protein n=1 Tax=Tigheibacillus jepli TaxID=3035914 RepID=A0ABU5CG47_9BACI|nr:hypothetical protein [Virgibacillus sp. 179-BFC.A HS]MDY0405291.1 hypothetical protein [Virgibacillus sp. 179-BFC.A HS]